MATSLYIFLLAFCLPLIQTPDLFATADEKLIQIQCHNANVPKTCINCLESDNRSQNADKFAIATLIVECLGKHATVLAGNLSLLATATPQHNASRKAYEDCVKLFSQAIKELQSATKEIMIGDYDSADRFVFSARRCNIECYLNLGKGKFVKEGVNSEMRVFEELSEGAMRIIERF